MLTDDRLAKMAAAGNQQAFAAIYERHHQALYRYCRSILGSDEDARDALQNTMLKALDALPGEQREIALRPWLFRVAHNEAISLIRRRPAPEAPLDEASASSEFDPATRERLRTLLDDLAALPERQRSALVMRELSGLSYADLAAALACSPAAAKQAVYEARVTLHELTEGREMECEAARKAISARDGRVLRGRKVRAHLRSCQSCRAFRSSIGNRSADLSLLAPPLPAGAAANMLQGLLGAGGGSIGGGGGFAGVIGGVGGQSLAGTAGMKALTAAVVVVAGAGAVDVATHATGLPNIGPDGLSLDSSDTSSDASAGGAVAGVHESTGGDSETAGGAGGGASGHEGERGNGGRKGAGDSGHSGSAPGKTHTTPGQSGTTPGQSGTTPGPGGTNPGQSGATPGQSGTTPGQSGTTPGQSGGAPDISGDAPGISGTAPGLGGAPPSQGGTPPGKP